MEFAILFLLFLFPLLLLFCDSAGINNCPMQVIRHIIVRTLEVVNEEDAPLQMQVIRRIMEDIYGGNWGVLIIKEPPLISTSVHWTFPDHRHRDGSAAFCLHMERGWQYNVFKTGDQDTEDRLTVEELVEQLNSLNSTQPAKRATKVEENDQKKTVGFFTNSLLIDRNK